MISSSIGIRQPVRGLQVPQCAQAERSLLSSAEHHRDANGRWRKPQRVDAAHPRVHLSSMSTVAEIETAITKLSPNEAEEVREWLEQWIEDQREITPEFLASIERGNADLAEGRTLAISALRQL